MWFIRLVKLKDPPSKESNAKMNEMRMEAEKWGVKFHHTFYTLGNIDLVNIFEAPDEKTAMRLSMAMAPWTRGAETLTAFSREEVDGWIQAM